MKLVKKSLIGATLVIAAIASSAATAGSLESIPGVSGSSYNLVIKNGVATLSGNADSGIERALITRHVQGIDGVDRVINLVTY